MSLTARIIPCLDIDKGRIVKGTNFVDLRDAGDPVEVARNYGQTGADEITFLDISASHENRQTIGDMVQQVAKEIFIPLTVGGGVRDIADIKRLLHCGADKVSINSAAISNPTIIKQAAEHFGRQCIVVAIDTRAVSRNRWEIFTHGGRHATGINAIEWAKKMASFGAGELLLTSMDKDGTKSGFDLELTAAISRTVHIPVIASGGVGTLQHLVEGILKGKAQAVLAASIFHFGEYSILETKQLMQKQGITVRL